MSQLNFTLKLPKSIRTSIFIIFTLLNIINTNSQNTINLHSLNDFIDDFKGIEICGDKYLTRTKSGDVLLSSDLGFNWSKLSLSKISKIISFENSENFKSKEKFISGNKFNFDFLKNLLTKKSESKEFKSEIKLSTPIENTVFISDDGKIFFSKNCGFDFLNENSLSDKTGTKEEPSSNLDSKLLVKDFVFHPDNQEKGIVIAYDDEGGIFQETRLDKGLVQVFLTENFGKTFRRIHSFNNEELKRFSDFTWFPLENTSSTNQFSGKLSDFFLGTFMKSLASSSIDKNNKSSNSNSLINKSLLAFYFENNIENNNFNTKDLENKISNILKNYLIELDSDDKNITSINTGNLSNYMVSSMRLIEGGFYCKTNLNDSASVPSHSMVIALNLISANEKNLRNLKSELKNNISNIYNNNNNSYKKARNLNNDNNEKDAEESFKELKLFFDVKFDFTKKSFTVEKINFNVANNIQISLPNDYEEVMKISENENFVFYIAKKFGLKCTGDLFAASKDRNLWTLSKKNLVLSQNENLINQEINSEFIADFVNVANSENIFMLNIYDKNFDANAVTESSNMSCGTFFEKNRNKIQTFISNDSAKNWSKLKNESNSRINIHMTSSWMNSNIYPLEFSKLGAIIANGSESEHLAFPFNNEKTNEFQPDDSIRSFISHDFGLIFNKLKDLINVFSFANYGNIVLIGESNKPIDTFSLSLDQGKTFLNYKINGGLLVIDRIFIFENNKIIAKKFDNFHFYNNEINKMHVSKKNEMLNNVLGLLSSEKDKKLQENLDGFLSKDSQLKGNSDPSLINDEVEKRIEKITEDTLNLNSQIPFDSNMLLGIQAHMLSDQLAEKLQQPKLTKALSDTYSHKILLTLNLNNLLSEKDTNNMQINISQSTKLTNQNQKAANNDLKKQQKKHTNSTSEIENKLDSFYQNLFNIKNPLNNKGFEYKHYFNKEDAQNFKSLLSKQLQKKTYLPACKQEDFEITELNSECVLGKKVFYYAKKKNIICAVDNFILQKKKAEFIKNYLTVLVNLYLANSQKDSAKSQEHTAEKISLFLKQVEPLFKLDLENYIPEILNGENFMVEKIENCSCDLLKDFECDENLQKEATLANNNFNKKSLFDKNSIYENCVKYLNYISNPAAESKSTKNSTNENKSESSIPKNANEFEVFKSAANSCFIGEKLSKVILSAKAENKSFKIDLLQETSILSISELLTGKNFYYNLISNKANDRDNNNDKGKSSSKANSNPDIIQEKDADSFKVNEQAGFGFLVIAFIAVVFVLFVYLGYLVIKNMIASYFPYKKARSDEHYDEPSVVGLKVRTRAGKSKELDSIY